MSDDWYNLLLSSITNTTPETVKELRERDALKIVYTEDANDD